jgi:hypothetical protein
VITLQDGVYVGLEPEKYFAADRLGSTDLVVLHNTPADWWYRSRLNPHYARTVTAEMEFGSGLHALLLEGEEAYAEAAVVSPFDSFRTKEAQIWRDQMRAEGRIILDADDDRRIRHMTALIQNHPELGGPMQKGLSEVSVLWTHEASGLRLRARIDKLLPRFSIDLKSFGGHARGVDMTQQCLWLVKDRHMDVQRFMYFLARQAMAGLIADGKIFGATPAQADWLRKVAAVETWRWCWIFYRRRDDEKGHAPIVKPIYRSHFDATFESGRQKFEVGLANYRTFMDRFGRNTPWAVIEAGEEPPDHAMPIGLNDCPPPFTFPDIQKDAA